MDKQLLLNELEELDRATVASFKNEEEVINWAARVVSILKLNSHVGYNEAVEYKRHLGIRELSPDHKTSCFNILKSIARELLEETRLNVKMEEGFLPQYHFPPNSRFEVQKLVAKILGSATTDLWIMDPYADEKILAELPTITGPKIQLLTSTRQNLFNQRLEAIKADNKLLLEVRVSSGFHQRMFVIDNAVVWVSDISYNSAGSKATNISRYQDEKEAKKAIQTFKEMWENAHS